MEVRSVKKLLYSVLSALFCSLNLLGQSIAPRAASFPTTGYGVSRVNPSSTIDPDFCGNKHKNLVLLKDIVQGTPRVVIPEFMGISSRRVEDFLKQHKKYQVIDILDEYERAIKLLQPTSSLLPMPIIRAARFLHFMSPDSSERAEAILKQIQKDIKYCFAHNPFPFTKDERELFNRIAQQNQFFMVRSTGVEDGAIANAGGNASIAYVNPTEKDIQCAMGEVIASYFGMQSLKNRSAGGENLTCELCLPVLIQVLIGEAFDGAGNQQDIPVSGVAYTTNQSLSSQNFTVTEINAAYGHGEGVVANRVTADRYFVTQSRTQNANNIYPMLYHKSERLVPHKDVSGNHTLITHTNDETLATKSALSQEQINNLCTILKKIEESYGKPMDVEFVVVDSTIYIVQARPAMYTPAQPSYLDLNTINPDDISQPLVGNCIVPGKANVLTITNPNDVIICKALDDADQNPQSTKCKAVIVDTWASSLSHAAVNFKTYGTPCIVVQDLSEAKKLINQISKEQPLLFDVQQQTIALWKNTQKDAESCIVNGWLEHPLNRTISVWTDALSVADVHTNPLPQDGKLASLFEKIKKSVDPQEQKKLLNDLVISIGQRISLTDRRIGHLGCCGDAFKKRFESFKSTLQTLLLELTTSIEQRAERFETLFYLKLLEALLYQKSENQKVLGGYTYTYFLNELYDKQAGFMAMLRLGTQNLLFGNFF